MFQMPKAPPRILVIAGSDSGGGAGIQADIKTVMALGGFATTAITALTAQNTLGVFAVQAVDPAFVVKQIEVILSDIGADAIKLGMLYSTATIEAVARTYERHAQRIPLVVDPVMVAKGGAPLLDAGGRRALLELLVPQASILTPNVPEAEVLTGLTIRNLQQADHALDFLLRLGAQAVLLKGGHLPGESVIDVLRTADGVEQRFESQRIATRSTHGTGCTLASAIATGIGEGLTLTDAVVRAHRYVFEAIRSAPPIGAGHGPLNHALSLESPRPPEPSEKPRVLH